MEALKNSNSNPNSHLHPNIVKLKAYCTTPMCLVLEFMSGGSLDKRLNDPRQCSDVISCIKIGISIAERMEYLHSKNIIHRILRLETFY